MYRNQRNIKKTILSSKDYMMKYKLKDDSISEDDLQKFIITLFSLEIV